MNKITIDFRTRRPCGWDRIDMLLIAINAASFGHSSTVGDWGWAVFYGVVVVGLIANRWFESGWWVA